MMPTGVQCPPAQLGDTASHFVAGAGFWGWAEGYGEAVVAVSAGGGGDRVR